MTPAIEARAVSVQIGAKRLLDRVSLAVAPGEVIALVGPNGAGKSTLLRTLSGEFAPTEGTVVLKGREPRAWGPRALARQRAVLSQSIAVTFPFTVAEIVRMGAGDLRGAKVEELVDAALAEVDLAGFRSRIIGTLSGGEQQRAHFARVLVQLAVGEQVSGPGILLLDEPTASLDLRHQLDLVAAARRCADRGVTVVAIVHDLNLATLLARRIIVLEQGRVATDGSPRDSINEDVLQRVFGVVSAVDRVPQPDLPFVLPQGARKHEPGPFAPGNA
jgi:iron complex transport system ATP-binding protein